MSIDFYLLPYQIFNFLYQRNFSFYRFLYFIYKRAKDRGGIELIRKLVKPGMTVVDVGANIGFYTVLLADLVGPKGVVHAFEPELNNHRHLKKICKGYPNIVVNRLAVGSRSGNTNLFVSRDLNVDHLTYNDGGSRGRVSIPCVSLDKYFGTKKRIDFVKIDTQGYEHQVLRGMTKVIHNSPRIVIVAEFSAFDLSLAGTRPEEHIELVKRLGLKTYIVGKKINFTDGSDLLTKNPNRAIYYNLLYVKGSQSMNF